MQAADLRKYIENPQLLNKQSVTQLQKLVSDFPYFQSAHVLLSIASKKWDATAYQQSLKKTAIVVTNRSHLFNLIHQIENGEEKLNEVGIVAEEKKEKSEINTIKENAEHELNILKAAEVSTEPVTEQKNEATRIDEKSKPDAEQVLEKEIAKEVVAAFVEKEILKAPELNHPKKIDKQEAESFVAWLALLRKNNGQSYEEIEKQVSTEKSKRQPTSQTTGDDTKKTDPVEVRKQKNKAIIDKIIESSPGLIRQKEEQKFYTPNNKAKESLLENEHLVTETLAKIYALQGNVNKAVRAYEILSLKFPQKSAYFASLIQKLKNK